MEEYKKRLICGADIQDLRELTGYNTTDITWLLGVLTHNWRITKNEGQKPLSRPTLSILVRYLLTYPEDGIVPIMPQSSEVFELIKEVYEGPRDLSHRRFGTMFGVSGWSGNEWDKKDNASPTVQRLFRIVQTAVEREGAAGLKKFLEIVDEDARMRGFGGMEDVFRAGSWKTREEK